jgi:hypothetical protein
MRAARRLVCLLLSLAAAGLAPMTSPSAAAQTSAPMPVATPRAGDAVRKRTVPAIDPARALLQMQAIIGRMAESSELVPADARELASIMTLVRGRKIADTALNALTMRIALAVAQGSFDEESVERLAQDLFAAANSRDLTVREASLLVTDVATLLRESGAEAASIEAASDALAAIGPDGTAVAGLERPDLLGAPARGLSVLTRR